MPAREAKDGRALHSKRRDVFKVAGADNATRGVGELQEAIRVWCLEREERSVIVENRRVEALIMPVCQKTLPAFGHIVCSKTSTSQAQKYAARIRIALSTSSKSIPSISFLRAMPPHAWPFVSILSRQQGWAARAGELAWHTRGKKRHKRRGGAKAIPAPHASRVKRLASRVRV